MRIGALAFAATVLYSFTSFAANTPTVGTIVSEKSVECGTKNKGKKTIKSSAAVLCQQYVVRAGTTEYEIRQPKPSSQAIIPANSAIQFAISKDKMKFKLNGKTYEFLIVGTSVITQRTNPAEQHPAAPDQVQKKGGFEKQQMGQVTQHRFSD